METLAIQSGDLEALVTVKQRDLSHPYSFLQIAEIYREANQYDDALEWAEKGAYSFSRIDPRLSDFLAGEYHRRGRHADAMTLIWEQFVENPGLPTYEKLRANAMEVKTSRDKLSLVGVPEQRANADLSRTLRSGAPAGQTVPDNENTEWCYWRENALRHLRESAKVLRETDNRSTSSIENSTSLVDAIRLSKPWERESDHSLLVEVFLWERQYEDAWHEATTGGCTEQLWRRLADTVAEEHPDRAFRVYQELIAPTIAPTNNMAYNDAIKLVSKMHKLASRLHREREFDEYLIALRTQYKLKRNFIKLLDRVKE
jgi:uncharacterized Zn finger protein